MTYTAIEVIARAIITRDDGSLLLARHRGREFVFLPGNHVELGEPTEKALLRELHEELDVDAEITGFSGAVEYTYTDNGQTHHEINLVFSAAITGDAASREEHLEFLWVPAGQLAEIDLRPSPIRTLVTEASPIPTWSGMAR